MCWYEWEIILFFLKKHLRSSRNWHEVSTTHSHNFSLLAHHAKANNWNYNKLYDKKTLINDAWYLILLTYKLKLILKNIKLIFSWTYSLTIKLWILFYYLLEKRNAQYIEMHDFFPFKKELMKRGRNLIKFVKLFS